MIDIGELSNEVRGEALAEEIIAKENLQKEHNNDFWVDVESFYEDYEDKDEKYTPPFYEVALMLNQTEGDRAFLTEKQGDQVETYFSLQLNDLIEKCSIQQ